MKATLIDAVLLFGRALEMLIFARVILSWVPQFAKNAFGRLIYALTDPIILPIRALIAKSPLGGPGMMLDLSPFIAYALIELLRMVIVSVIRSF